MNRTADTLALLHVASYSELFEEGDDALCRRILSAPDAIARLRRHVNDSRASASSRLCAAELVMLVQDDFPSAWESVVVAQVYALGLAQSETADRWGRPGFGLGPAGERFVGLGLAALGPLVPLLDDERSVPFHDDGVPSVRVKDLAALVATRVVGLWYALDDVPELRDDEIRILKRRLDVRH